MSRPQLVRLVGANLRARLLALAALTVTSLVVARTSGAAGVGELTLFRVLPWLTGLALSNGVYAAAPYFLSGPDRGEPRYRSTIPAMAVAAGVVGGLAWAAATPLTAGGLFPGVPPVLVAAAGVSVLTQLVESTGKACSQGSGDWTGSNRVIVLEELLFLPWYAGLLGTGTSTAAAIVFALPLGDLSTAIPTWVRLARRGYFTDAWPVSVRLARNVSRYGLRAEVGSLMQTLNARLDFTIVAALLGPKSLGIYAIASRYAELLRVPSLALNYVLLPTYARDGGMAAAGGASRALRRLWWTPLAAAVPMALLAPIVLPLAYGADFHASAAPAYVLLAGLSGGVVTGIASAYLAGTGRPGLGSVGIGAGLAVTVVLDVLLIPRWHVMGAAVASTAAYLTTAAVLMALFRKASATPRPKTPTAKDRPLQVTS
jgi:O-antigen/teichoic acid export membrane protein